MLNRKEKRRIKRGEEEEEEAWAIWPEGKRRKEEKEVVKVNSKLKGLNKYSLNSRLTGPTGLTTTTK